jgi:hypothetical protein
MNRRHVALVLSLALAVPAAAAPKPRKAAAPPAAAAAAAPAATPGAVLLDNFEAVDWASTKHDGTEVALSRADGRTGGALAVAYDLKDTKQWVQISKPFSVESLSGRALEFWVKGSGAANALEIKVVDADGSNFGVKRDGLTDTVEWTRVTVTEADLSYWWGGDPKMDAVKELYFAVSAGAGGAGELRLDDLNLVPARGGLDEAGYLTRGDATEGWATAQGDGARASLALGAGQDGQALALTYEIPANQWVSMRKAVDRACGPASALLLRVRGEGDLNNVEVKLVDRDGSTFGKLVEGLAGDPAWQELRVPFSELKYFWGGDDRLDATLIRFFELAVSGPGGKGTLFVDEVKLGQ